MVLGLLCIVRECSAYLTRSQSNLFDYICLHEIWREFGNKHLSILLLLSMMRNNVRLIRVDFSLRREVFFVVVGAIVGALIMIIPKIILEVGMGLPYYLTWTYCWHLFTGVHHSRNNDPYSDSHFHRNNLR